MRQSMSSAKKNVLTQRKLLVLLLIQLLLEIATQGTRALMLLVQLLNKPHMYPHALPLPPSTVAL